MVGARALFTRANFTCNLNLTKLTQSFHRSVTLKLALNVICCQLLLSQLGLFDTSLHGEGRKNTVTIVNFPLSPVGKPFLAIILRSFTSFVFRCKLCVCGLKEQIVLVLSQRKQSMDNKHLNVATKS